MNRMKRLISLVLGMALLVTGALATNTVAQAHAATPVAQATGSPTHTPPGAPGAKKPTRPHLTRVIHTTTLKPSMQPHKQFAPTVKAAAAQARAATDAIGATCASPCDLQWHGGSLQYAPSVAILFWGPSWSATATSGTAVTADGQVPSNLLNDLGSPYNGGATAYGDVLTQYYDAYEWASPNVFSDGYYVDASTPPTDTSCGANTIEDSAIQAQLSADSSNLYGNVIFVDTPTGYVINAGTVSNPICSSSFCSYTVAYSASSSFQYVGVPYPDNLTACPDIGGRTPNGSAAGDSLANTTAAALFNLITDPDGSTGWYDATGQQIADKCHNVDPGSNVTLNHGGVFSLQPQYSNLTHSCVTAFAPPHLQVSPNVVTVIANLGGTIAPQTVTVSNTGSGTLQWYLQPNYGTGHCLQISPTFGSLAAGTSQNVTLTYTCPVAGAYQFAIGLSFVANSDNSYVNVPVTLMFTAPATTWYFAEGYTGTGFTEYLTLENPNSVAANVNVEYLLGAGSPINATYVVNPNQRKTVNVNTAISASTNKNVSMVVTSDVGIIAERPMYFTYTGLASYSIPGGSDIVGVNTLGTAYDFGYLDSTTGHDTYLTILNPNSGAMTVNVALYDAGGTAYSRSTTVAGDHRGTMRLANLGVPAGTYSAAVTLSEPGMVERPMYLVDGTTGYNGATDMVGVAPPGPYQFYHFAAGNNETTPSNYDERYILANPTATATSANPTICLYYYSGASQYSTCTSVPIAAHAQVIVDANSILGSVHTSHSAIVYGNGSPLLVERYMSFDYTGPVGGAGSSNIQGATDVMGGTSGYLFDFAEGYTGNGFHEDLSVFNPCDVYLSSCPQAHVTVTFYPQSGAAATVRQYTINSFDHLTLDTSTVMPNQSFSMSVSSDVPVLAERTEYFKYNNTLPGGSDVIGYQPPATQF